MKCAIILRGCDIYIRKVFIHYSVLENVKRFNDKTKFLFKQPNPYRNQLGRLLQIVTNPFDRRESRKVHVVSSAHVDPKDGRFLRNAVSTVNEIWRTAKKESVWSSQAMGMLLVCLLIIKPSARENKVAYAYTNTH